MHGLDPQLVGIPPFIKGEAPGHVEPGASGDVRTRSATNLGSYLVDPFDEGVELGRNLGPYPCPQPARLPARIGIPVFLTSTWPSLSQANRSALPTTQDGHHDRACKPLADVAVEDR